MDHRVVRSFGADSADRSGRHHEQGSPSIDALEPRMARRATILKCLGRATYSFESECDFQAIFSVLLELFRVLSSGAPPKLARADSDGSTMRTSGGVPPLECESPRFDLRRANSSSKPISRDSHEPPFSRGEAVIRTRGPRHVDRILAPLWSPGPAVIVLNQRSAPRNAGRLECITRISGKASLSPSNAPKRRLRRRRDASTRSRDGQEGGKRRTRIA